MDLTLPNLSSDRKRLSGPSLRDMGDIAVGKIGPVDFDLKRLQLQTRINDAVLTGRLKPNGEWNVNITKPVQGGNFTFDANHEKEYMLRFNKNF